MDLGLRYTARQLHPCGNPSPSRPVKMSSKRVAWSHAEGWFTLKPGPHPLLVRRRTNIGVELVRPSGLRLYGVAEHGSDLEVTRVPWRRLVSDLLAQCYLLVFEYVCAMSYHACVCVPPRE
jgi:hypothetical protein